MPVPVQVPVDTFTKNAFGDTIVDELYLASLMCYGGGYLSRVETDATGKAAKWFIKMEIEDARIYQAELASSDSHLIGIKNFVDAIKLCVAKKLAAKMQG